MRIFSHIRSSSRRSYDVIGTVAHTSDAQAPGSLLGLPHFGNIDVLERMIRQDAVDTVLIALPWSAGEQTRAIIDRISMAPVDIYIYPGMNGLNLPLRRADRTLDLPLLMVCARPIGGRGALLKRAEDVVLFSRAAGFYFACDAYHRGCDQTDVEGTGAVSPTAARV